MRGIGVEADEFIASEHFSEVRHRSRPWKTLWRNQEATYLQKLSFPQKLKERVELPIRLQALQVEIESSFEGGEELEEGVEVGGVGKE